MLGRPLYRFERVSSTMDVLAELATAGAPEGTAVVASFQEAGRGRADRRWEVPAGQALLASVLLRPALPLPRLMPLSILVADAIREAVRAICGVDALIKWPNDVLVGGRKLSGVLIQTRQIPSKNNLSARKTTVIPSAVEGSRDFGVTRSLDCARDDGLRPGRSMVERELSVMVGFGINANVARRELPPTGTSLLAESGAAVDLDALLRGVLDALEVRYRDLLADRVTLRWAAIQEHLEMRGERVQVEDAGRLVTGTLLRVDPDGALVLAVDGRERRIVAGDLSRGPKPVAS